MVTFLLNELLYTIQSLAWCHFQKDTQCLVIVSVAGAAFQPRYPEGHPQMGLT